MTESLKELCVRLEHFETPEWAAKAILSKEELTEYVIDPCCGTGVLATVAFDISAHVHCIDITKWGYKFQHETNDFLTISKLPYAGEWTVFMNPPFSLATQFVEKCFELGVQKIICFQRFAWWESRKRREFWAKYSPSRVYICGDRADCWRHDIPKDQRGSSSPTAHAWFVWERGQPSGTLLGHIYKDDAQ